MNPKAPKILNDIVSALQTAGLTAVTEGKDGRHKSSKDEENVIAWLQEQAQFKDHIEDTTSRKFGDMIVKDEVGVEHYVNIKTSIGRNDNAFSKLGFLWAFTNLSIADFEERKISNKIKNENWTKTILEYKADVDRDYWFLFLNKLDFSNVVVRGVKQINYWIPNPTNNLQVVWGKEIKVPPKDVSFEQAWEDVIVKGVFYAWEKDVEGKTLGLDYRRNYLDNLNK